MEDYSRYTHTQLIEVINRLERKIASMEADDEIAEAEMTALMKEAVGEQEWERILRRVRAGER